MRVTDTLIEINSKSIPWAKVKAISSTSDGLVLTLKNGQKVEAKGVHRTVADAAFRAFNASRR